MKGNILIWPVAFLIIFLMTSCSLDKSSFYAKNGRLDLSHWDAKKDGIVKLDGEWELYQGVFIEPSEFKSGFLPAKADYLVVPSIYKNTTDGEGTLSKDGYATLRLVVKLPTEDVQLLGIISRQILSASKIWIDGQLVSSAGNVGENAEGTKGSFERQLAFINGEKNEIEIVIHMSNYNNVTGKVRNILLGDSKQIKRAYITAVGTDLFIAGALFIMAIYHFGLYLKRTKHKETLYFGLFCLMIAIRNVLVGGRFIYEIYPEMPFSVLNKLAYLTVYIGFPVLVMFFKELFPKEIPARVSTGLNGISAIVTLLTVITKIEFYNIFLIYFEALILIFFIYLFVIIIRASMRRVENSWIILFGVVTFVFAAVNDMLLQTGVIQTRSLASYGFFIFIFSQSYMLAAQFSDAFIHIEKLIEENKEVYIDTLTGLLNRRGFFKNVEELMEPSRASEHFFIVIYADINKLKKINDTYGHGEGDEAIKMAGSILRDSFDTKDIVARMSGDEFIVIALQSSTEIDAKEVIQRIHDNFTRYNHSSGKSYTLSIGIGYTLFTQESEKTLDELVSEADKFLYKNKISTSVIS